MAEKYFSQPSVLDAQAHFSQIPGAEIERSRFDRSHGVKTTLDAAYLVPIYWDEVIPGDTFDMHSTLVARMATPLKPIMDNVYIDVHYFFVPNRLIWTHWEHLMGRRDDATVNDPGYTVPQCKWSFTAGTNAISQYLGLPKNNVTGLPAPNVSALPFRAYYAIYDDWYRDENFVPLTRNVTWHDDETLDDFSTRVCLTRLKRKDYFTSALPWPQKGSPVYIPLGTTAPVKTNQQPVRVASVNLPTDFRNMIINNNAAFQGLGYTGAIGTSGTNVVFGDQSGLYADLTAATAMTINDLRTAFQVQKLLERDARGGTRYIEIILSHFGVRGEDFRLQRCEYLGGGTTMVNINPIAQTYQVPTSTTPMGNLSAFGQAVHKCGFSKSFVEHGIVMGICSIRSDLTYQNGIERYWGKKTRYDFYWPALAHLGEQPIKNAEIFADGSANDTGTWGYQERYAEYRYKPSQVTGKMASTIATPLDMWHLAQNWTALPPLNAGFLAENPPFSRIMAVTSEPHFLMDGWFSLQCTRPMPVYSVPGLIDHF